MRAPRCVRALLALYPRDFRRARGAEVEAHVVAELRDAGTKGRRSALTARVRIALDLAAGAVRLRWRPVRRTGPRTDDDEGGWMMRMLQDVRHAARTLARAPIFTVVVALTLAVGVGLDAAIFSVVNAVLIRPLEYAEAERLVYLTARAEEADLDHALVPGGHLEELRRGVSSLDRVEGVALIRQNLVGAGLPRQVEVAWSSPGFLDLLGVRPALGRLFRPDDPPGTVVLTHALWRDHLGADSAAVGRTVRLDGNVYVIAGVLPADFRLRLPTRRSEWSPEIWKNPDGLWQNGDVWNDQTAGMLRLVGRLAPGATMAVAQQEVDAVMAGLGERVPELTDMGWAMSVAPLHERVVEEVRPTLLLLLGAVGFVLLIACANVANLMLARTHARSREVALRMALGSSGGRIAGLLLSETALLTGGGALGGAFVAIVAVEVMTALGPDTLPLLDTVSVDLRVLGFGVGMVVVTSVLVGAWPALRAAATRPARGLGQGGRGASVAGSAFRHALVVAQVALSLVLLVGAGLLTTSLVHLQRVEPGFEPDDIFTFSVSVPSSRYDWPGEADRFYREVERRVAELQGVESAGVIWPLPLSGSNWSGAFTGGEVEAEDQRFADYLLATEGYFPTIGVPIVDGRLFGPDLDPKTSVVVSRSLAERSWPAGSAVGRTLTADPWGRGPSEFEVVGVVGDVRQEDIRDDPEDAIYFDSRGWSWVDWEVDVVARTSLPPDRLVPALREVVAGLDAEIPLAEAEPLVDIVARQTEAVRFALTLLGVFAAVAGLLALLGLYGVVAYTVGQRRREVGIRMALGSARSRVLGHFVAHGLRLTAAGVAVGVVAALVLTRFLRAWLYRVEPTDPVTFVLVGVGLAAAATLATWIPARRAARVDPVTVLGCD